MCRTGILKTEPKRPLRLALTARLLAKLFNVKLEVISRLRPRDLALKNFRRIRLLGNWTEVPESF